MNRGSHPLLGVERIAIRYSLRDLLPGSAHRFGITGVDVAGARADADAVSRRQLQLELPAGRGRAQDRSASTRFRCACTSRCATRRSSCASLSAYDASAKDHPHRAAYTRDADVDTAAVTHYRVRGAFERESPEPFTIVGTSRRDTRLRDPSRARDAFSAARAGELLRRHAAGAHPARDGGELRRAPVLARRRAERRSVVSREPKRRRDVTDAWRWLALAAPIEQFRARAGGHRQRLLRRRARRDARRHTADGSTAAHTISPAR